MATGFTKLKRELTWLITGCSSGLGLSLARIAQAAGHRVLATSRNPSRTPALVAEVESKGGNGEFIAGLEKAGEQIDVLVNNAGYSLHAPVETFTEDEIRAQMETMYLAPLRLIRSVLLYMRKRRYGVVVNISSGASLDGREGMGGYAGAKAGLDGITRVLAKEAARFNIRTLTVILGGFNTNMPNAALRGKAPFPEDYIGSPAEQLIQSIESGKFVPRGDKDKAMEVLYEVIVGEGAGKGREEERVLPLGPDIISRVEGVREELAHSLEVFGEVTESVNIDQ